MAQDDIVMDLRLGVGLGGAVAAEGKWEVIEDTNGVDAGRDMEKMRTGIRRQCLVAKQIMCTVVGAIVEAFVAGKAKLAAGPDITLGRGTRIRVVGAFDHTIVLGHEQTELKRLVRRAPCDGGKRPQLSRKMGHHVEMIHFLGDKRGISFHIDQGEVLARMMNKDAFLSQL